MSNTPHTLDTSRRALLTGQGPASSSRWKNFDPVAAERASRLAHLQRLAPNVPVVSHDGRALRFYDDVLKGRQVVLSAMYSACEQSCPPSMRNLIEARQMLGPLSRDLRFVTLTLTPLDDGPQQLREYKQRFGIGPEWLFLTGQPAQMERIQSALGYTPQRAADSLLSHASMVRVCDERRMRWGHVNSLTSAQNIARMVRFELA
jgi:protein SCO1